MLPPRDETPELDWSDYEGFLEKPDEADETPWVFEWKTAFVEKLAAKHGVQIGEVEECFANDPLLLFQARGSVVGEDVYLAYGRSDAGRFLLVVFISKGQSIVLPVSARDMSEGERKSYAKRKKS